MSGIKSDDWTKRWGVSPPSLKGAFGQALKLTDRDGRPFYLRFQELAGMEPGKLHVIDMNKEQEIQRIQRWGRDRTNTVEKFVEILVSDPKGILQNVIEKVPDKYKNDIRDKFPQFAQWEEQHKHATAAFEILANQNEQILLERGLSKQCLEQMGNIGLGQFIPKMAQHLTELHSGRRPGGGKAPRGSDLYMQASSPETEWRTLARDHLRAAGLIE